jgi:predicted O-methyltransferase YrrM
MINVLRTKFKSFRSEKRYPRLIRAAAFAYRHAKQFKALVSLPLAVHEVRKAVTACDPASGAAAEKGLETAFTGAYRVIRPYQNHSEIKRLLDLLRMRKLKRLLEIGTANGGTLFLFCRVAHPNAYIVSVDLPGGWFGGGYPSWKGRLYRQFAASGQKLELIRADSHRAETFALVEKMLAGNKFDFIFIDGDHTYEGVSQDYDRYRTLLADDGIIGLHDIVPNASDPDCEVPRFWNDLRRHHETVEFVNDPAQHGAGIGIVLPAASPHRQSQNRSLPTKGT